MKWRHAEAWISLTTDTADGFEMEAEFHMHDTPTIVALVKGPSLIAAIGACDLYCSSNSCNGSYIPHFKPPKNIFFPSHCFFHGTVHGTAPIVALVKGPSSIATKGPCNF